MRGVIAREYRVRLLTVLISTCLFPTLLPAQDQTTPAAQTATIESLSAALKEVEANTDLEAAARTRLVEFYTKAIQELRDETTARGEIARLQAEAERASEDLKSVRQKLEAPSLEIEKPAASADLTTVQQRLSTFEEDLRTAEKRATTLTDKVTRRAQRRSVVPAELEETRKSLAALEGEIAALASEPDAPEKKAKQAYLNARRRSLRAKLDLLERELPVYDATAALLAAESDLAARRLTEARKTVQAWQEYVNQRRRTEAENNLREAEEIAASVQDLAKPLARDLVDLAGELVQKRATLSDKIAGALASIQKIEKDTARLESEFSEITERAEVAGFTNAVGVLLRKQRTALPSLGDLKAAVRELQTTISDAHVDRIEFQNQRATVSDVETSVESLVTARGKELDEDQQRELGNDFRRILQARGRYLDGVIQDLSSYLDRLATLDTRQRALIAQTEQQAAYIAEHILWVRSTRGIDWKTVQEAGAASGWLLQQFQSLGASVATDVSDNRLAWITAGLILAGFFFVQHRARQRLRPVAELAAKRNTVSMKPTLRGLAITFLLAIPVPLALVFLGWRMSTLPGLASKAAASACFGCAVLLITVDMLRHSCRRDGLGIGHFGWHEGLVTAARKPLRVFLIVVIPLAGIVVFLEEMRNDLYLASLGRLLLMLALAVSAYGAHRVLSVKEFPVAAKGGKRWQTFLRCGCYALGVGVPLVLFALAAAGFLYSARQLSRSLILSGWLLLVVVLLASLLHRWQLLTYRALAMQQARQRREELQQQQQQQEGAVQEEVRAGAFDDQAEALSESNQKLSKLQSIGFVILSVVGLAVIWNDVLPAFGFLGNVQLWQSGIVSEVIEGVEKHEWITLKEVLFAIITVLATVFAARNLPALLEFAVLQRLPVDSGVKYASSAVVRYILTTIGVVLAFRFLGVGWSNVQWLVAAMTVGLGFGLQEIFANFVSGLILLFERPIRVGDTITVGDVTGTVTRIRIRATTIVDWDRKELVVPNREFVTGQLVNWTLSDTVLRVMQPVGIAYGSDTRLATKLLYQVAEENPDVLSDPHPVVVFNQFGESSLDFELRCHVNSPEAYRTIAHRLNTAIDDLFREHGIEIAFPQRDLHLRSMDFTMKVDSNASERPRLAGSELE